MAPRRAGAPGRSQGGNRRLPQRWSQPVKVAGGQGQGQGRRQGPSRSGAAPEARVVWHGGPPSSADARHTHRRMRPRSLTLPDRGQAQMSLETHTGPSRPTHTHTHRPTPAGLVHTLGDTCGHTHPAPGSFPASSVGILQAAGSQRQDCKARPCLPSAVPRGWRPRVRRAGEGPGHAPQWPHTPPAHVGRAPRDGGLTWGAGRGGGLGEQEQQESLICTVRPLESLLLQYTLTKIESHFISIQQQQKNQFPGLLHG